jgi:hypothetical protein
MILTLLSHQWKSFWRGRGVSKSIAMQVFLGFIILYLLASCLVLGFALGHLLSRLSPGQDTVKVYCGLILYYFALDLVMRFLLQELPILSTQPYLAQNIRRSQLVAYLNIRSLFHFLNILPLFIFIPFIVTNIVPAYGAAASTVIAASILSMTVFNHFFMLYIIRRSVLNAWWLAGFFFAIVAFAALDYFHVLSLSAISTFLFVRILFHPLLAFIPLVLATLSFLNNRRFLLKNLYIEELSKRSGEKRSTEYTWLQQWGTLGELVGLDIKLITRNKRPKYVAIMSIIFTLYGFIFFRHENLAHFNFYALLFPAIFMTGLFIINYGQFAFAWQSSCFDGLLVGNLPVSEYIRGKFLLFNVSSTLSFIITSLYGFIDWRLLPILTAAWLYNLGLNSAITLWFATYSYKGIDLSKSATFNYQGIGAAQWIWALVALIGPYVIILPFLLLGFPWLGIAALGIAGLISFLFRNWWITFLTAEFFKRKHLILQGFRER